MKTILLVEDDVKIARALRDRLKHSGFSVVVASDAPSALMVARNENPDLALLDISIPGGNGIDVADKLHALTHDRLLPVIFITASKEQRLKVEAEKVGAVAFLEKPFAAKKLLSVIDGAFNGYSRKTEFAEAIRI